MDNRLKPMIFAIRSFDDGLQDFAEAMRAIERGEKVCADKIGNVYFVHRKAFKDYLIECFGRMGQGV